MEQINYIVALVKDHWVEVLAAIGALDVLLGIITKLTPIKWDDNLYSVLHGWIAKLVKK